MASRQSRLTLAEIVSTATLATVVTAGAVLSGDPAASATGAKGGLIWVSD